MSFVECPPVCQVVIMAKREASNSCRNGNCKFTSFYLISGKADLISKRVLSCRYWLCQSHTFDMTVCSSWDVCILNLKADMFRFSLFMFVWKLWKFHGFRFPFIWSDCSLPPTPCVSTVLTCFNMFQHVSTLNRVPWRPRLHGIMLFSPLGGERSCLKRQCGQAT